MSSVPPLRSKKLQPHDQTTTTEKILTPEQRQILKTMTQGETFKQSISFTWTILKFIIESSSDKTISPTQEDEAKKVIEDTLENIWSDIADNANILQNKADFETHINKKLSDNFSKNEATKNFFVKDQKILNSMTTELIRKAFQKELETALKDLSGTPKK